MTDYTVTADGKVVYRTSATGGGTDAEARQRAEEVTVEATKRYPAARVLMVVSR